MFKEVTKFFKDENTKWFFVIAIVLLIIWSLMSYSDSKGKVVDNMYAQNTAVKPFTTELNGQEESATVADYTAPVSQNISAANTCANGSGYNLQPVSDPKDLLPSDKNSEWAKLNPVNNDQQMLPDMLSAGNLIGLDSVASSLRNANQQLRSDPVIARVDTGPWQQSTIEPDSGRTPLEIGCTVAN
jgi:hypothetical protein